MRIRQFAGLSVRYILLAVIGLGLSIPLFDQTTIERTPWHEHLVFGGTAVERVRALEAHLRGSAWPSEPATNGPLTPPPNAGPGQHGKARGGVSIISIPGRLSAASIGIGGPGLAAPDSIACVIAPSRGGPMFHFGPLLFTEVPLSIPEPPPRSAA